MCIDQVEFLPFANLPAQQWQHGAAKSARGAELIPILGTTG